MAKEMKKESESDKECVPYGAVFYEKSGSEDSRMKNICGGDNKQKRRRIVNPTAKTTRQKFTK